MHREEIQAAESLGQDCCKIDGRQCMDGMIIYQIGSIQAMQREGQRHSRARPEPLEGARLMLDLNCARCDQLGRSRAVSWDSHGLYV
jgi:hypothetical protein